MRHDSTKKIACQQRNYISIGPQLQHHKKHDKECNGTHKNGSSSTTSRKSALQQQKRFSGSLLRNPTPCIRCTLETFPRQAPRRLAVLCSSKKPTFAKTSDFGTKQEAKAHSYVTVRDALELKETAKDIILRRPTHKRRDMPEFRAAWMNDNDVLMRKLPSTLPSMKFAIPSTLPATTGCATSRAPQPATKHSSTGCRKRSTNGTSRRPVCRQSSPRRTSRRWARRPRRLCSGSRTGRAIHQTAHRVGPAANASRVSTDRLASVGYPLRCCTRARRPWPPLDSSPPAGAPAPCCSLRRPYRHVTPVLLSMLLGLQAQIMAGIRGHVADGSAEARACGRLASRCYRRRRRRR